MKNLDKKKDLVVRLVGDISKATSIVIIDPSHLTVKLQQELKKRLKGVGASLLIVKNTLLKIAGEESKLAKETTTDEILSGPTALVLGTGDSIAPLQVLAKFASEFEVVNFKAGIVDGAFQDKLALGTLSKLPGKSVLLSQVLGSITAPLYGLVGTLQGNLQKLIYVLDTKAKAGGE